MNEMVNLVKSAWRTKYLVLFTLFASNLVQQPAPEVVVAQGRLSGVVSSDGTVHEYLGIPYATANITNRYQAPLPPPSWDGVFKAHQDIYQCPQKSPLFGVVGVEDCLKMNVYVPASSGGPYPVMFNIHGGAFALGSGGKLLYGPEFIVKRDVILVSFHYRLGALGFLCLGTKEVPGNAGLKDQLAALQWVKRNIAAFGGDPDNITIFGESAGGASVSLFIASESTKGLFKRAIIQSGSSVSSWAINSKPVWTASLIAQELGFKTNDVQKLHEIFSQINYKDLTRVRVEKPDYTYLQVQLISTPCVENSLPGIKPFLTDLPYNVISRNAINVPVILGTTSREGLFFIKLDTEESLVKRNSIYLLPDDLEFTAEEEAAAAAQRVKQFYFGQKRIGLDTLSNMSDLYTHWYFEMPSLFESEIYLGKPKSKVYNYYFNYSGWRNFLKILFGYFKEPGSCHGDELMYLFKGRIWPFWITSKDQRMIDYLTKMWTNFAKFGDPTPGPVSDLPVKWEPSQKGNLKFMYIEDDLRMGSMPNPEAYQMWTDIYRKHRRK